MSDPDPATESKLTDLERRVHALETKVASLPDVQQIDARIQANLPPPVDPTKPPGLQDIALPIPNVETIVTTAKTTWGIVELFGEMATLLWMLIDRRYHMGWFSRIITIGLLIAILTSHWWAPFAVYDNFISHLWDKVIDLVLGLILFMVLIFETRRYKAWRGG